MRLTFFSDHWFTDIVVVVNILSDELLDPLYLVDVPPHLADLAGLMVKPDLSMQPLAVPPCRTLALNCSELFSLDSASCPHLKTLTGSSKIIYFSIDMATTKGRTCPMNRDDVLFLKKTHFGFFIQYFFTAFTLVYFLFFFFIDIFMNYAPNITESDPPVNTKSVVMVTKLLLYFCFFVRAEYVDEEQDYSSLR